jgi:hypothetical protein
MLELCAEGLADLRIKAAAARSAAKVEDDDEPWF